MSGLYIIFRSLRAQILITDRYRDKTNLGTGERQAGCHNINSESLEALKKMFASDIRQNGTVGTMNSFTSFVSA